MRLFRLFTATRKSLPQVIPLMRHPRVPLALKILTGIAALLIVSPIDLFGDLPVIGALDDAALLTLAAMVFVRLAGRHVEPVPVTVPARL